MDSLLLDSVGVRLGAGQLTSDDAHALWATTDLVRIGALADEVRRKRHGDRVTFVRVADVPAGAWQNAAVPAAAGEIRLTGLPSSIVRANGVPVTGFSLFDLHQVTGGGSALHDLAKRLADAGLAAVAEAPVDRLKDLRSALSPVLEAGIPVARFTVDRLDVDPVEIVVGVRQLQKTTGAVRVFAPLPRRLDPTHLSTGYDDVKLVALARLVVDNVSSIQVDWSLYGPKLAQVALLFGADDLDGVSPHDDAPQGKRRAPLEEVRRNIRAASLSPVERDGRFGVRE